jgi:hypothetical protein
MNGADDGDRADGHVAEPLEDAQRAGFESLGELEPVPVAEQRGAQEGDRGIETARVEREIGDGSHADAFIERPILNDP